MRRFSFITLICLIAAQSAVGAEYCAVKLHVMWSDGRPITGAEVTLYDKNNNLIERTRSIEGIADLCDLPFGYNTIEIGEEDGCDIVSIRNVIDK